MFTVNTLGTQFDMKVDNESVFDNNWNGKWEAKIAKHTQLERGVQQSVS